MRVRLNLFNANAIVNGQPGIHPQLPFRNGFFCLPVTIFTDGTSRQILGVFFMARLPNRNPFETKYARIAAVTASTSIPSESNPSARPSRQLPFHTAAVSHPPSTRMPVRFKLIVASTGITLFRELNPELHRVIQRFRLSLSIIGPKHSTAVSTPHLFAEVGQGDLRAPPASRAGPDEKIHPRHHRLLSRYTNHGSPSSLPQTLAAGYRNGGDFQTWIFANPATSPSESCLHSLVRRQY